MAVYTIRRTVAGRSEFFSNFRNGERRVACFEARRCADVVARRVPSNRSRPVRVVRPDGGIRTNEGDAWFEPLAMVQVEEVTFARISSDMGIARVPVDVCVVVDDAVQVERSIVLVAKQNSETDYVRRRLELDFEREL